MKIQNTFKANVIWGSLGFSLAIIAALLFDTQQTISYLAAAKHLFSLNLAGFIFY